MILWNSSAYRDGSLWRYIWEHVQYIINWATESILKCWLVRKDCCDGLEMKQLIIIRRSLINKDGKEARVTGWELDFQKFRCAFGSWCKYTRLFHPSLHWKESQIWQEHVLFLACAILPISTLISNAMCMCTVLSVAETAVFTYFIFEVLKLTTITTLSSLWEKYPPEV